MTAALEVLLDEACDPLYEATVECTEEAIVNALCMSEEMRGQSGHVAPALPLDQLCEILQKYRQAFRQDDESHRAKPGGPSRDQDGDPGRVPEPPRDESLRAKPGGPSRE